MALSYLRHFAPILGAVACLQAQAQTPPDAGRTLQQLQAPMAAPRAAGQVPGAPAPTVPDASRPNTVTVVLRSVRFNGNSRLDDAALRQSIGAVTGKAYDLAGLRALADAVTLLYRNQGFPFARAYLPQQQLQQGDLTIAVIEGRYGSVQARADESRLAQDAQAFVARLQPGSVIEGEALERSLLLLQDLPGIVTSPVMQPGQTVGTGDLEIQVARVDTVSGEVGLDNSGSRFTGARLARGGLRVNGAFTLGDQITVRGLTSNGGLNLVAFGYSLPMGTDGWRVQASLSRTEYRLGKEFASLDARGSAEVGSVTVNYPLVRSRSRNLTLGVGYLVKLLHDSQGATNTQSDKSSRSVPLSLQFDQRDSLGGASVSHGGLTWTPGRLKLDSALGAVDTLRTAGSFNKLNLDLVRLQSLPGAWSLMGRLSTQWANKNLDSSEKMGLGGASGVRAYPTGEASGDEAWLAQVELRYIAGAVSPYLFVDAGHVRANAKPLATAVGNGRSLGGAGVGARYQQGPLGIDATLAWPTHGGASIGDAGKESKPRAWVTLNYRL